MAGTHPAGQTPDAGHVMSSDGGLGDDGVRLGSHPAGQTPDAGHGMLSDGGLGDDGGRLGLQPAGQTPDDRGAASARDRSPDSGAGTTARRSRTGETLIRHEPEKMPTTAMSASPDAEVLVTC